MTKSARRLVTTTVVAVCLGAGFLAIELRTVARRYLAGVQGHRTAAIIRQPVPSALVHRTDNPGIRNIAPFATVSVSSVEESDTESAKGVADGVADSKEWVTEGETAGAWIKLDWASPATISRVDLYHLPNPAGNVLSGTLMFDDGTVIPVESLSPERNPARIAFPAKTVRSVMFRIDQAQGINTGLVEIMVFGTLN
jgi:hypothetical protein